MYENNYNRQQRQNRKPRGGFNSNGTNGDRRFRHGQCLNVELMPSVIDGLKALAERNGTSLFHEARRAIYQLLDRELGDFSDQEQAATDPGTSFFTP